MNAPPTSAPASSTVLWATASKEWVLPPKPKPGRKPKKETVAASKTADEEVDSQGRRTQNRAAQRAFRERKQSQLSELQARIERYEQGEIERNVALQNVAKRLKEENERLRAENVTLKDTIASLEKERDLATENSRKRWREDTPDYPMKKLKVPPTATTQLSSLPAPYESTPPSMASSPGSSIDTRFSPFSFDPSPEPGNDPMSLGGLDMPAAPQFDCGFCNEDTTCVCREIAMQSAANDGPMNMKTESLDDIIIIPATQQSTMPEPPQKISILDNLPQYQAPVPLPKRKPASLRQSIFKVTPAVNVATCSGDPSNCSACADDSFGRAFCEAIGNSTTTFTPCPDCPGDCGKASSSTMSTQPSLKPPMITLSAACDPRTMPTNDAWHRLKAHPKASFADLALLADVVARRSKCTGPRVVISPAPGAVTPERDVRPQSIMEPDKVGEHDSTKLGDSVSSAGTGIPHSAARNTPLHCGKQRIREVEVDAVQDALRMLDARNNIF